MRCLKEYQDSCEGMKYFRSQDEYNEIYGAFRDVCEEGTLFNTVVNKHLKCFNETFSTTSCTGKMKTLTGPYRQVVKNTEDEYEYYLPISMMCMQDILESSCVAAEIGQNCGQDALKATLDFLRRTSYDKEFCKKNSAEFLLPNLGQFPLSNEQKELLIATLESIIISGMEVKNIIPY
ncbi:unnamed protein product [Larinioides sclopetarius]|uniref:Uncharacterized protein n=1 Tax=Larinioides sclopetarius TaxID=280406 RepID=A0AAV2BZB9_9ARAC